MSGRRIDWPAVALYTVLGAAALAFFGFVLWRLALAVNWTASALLGLVIVFGLLMVSFDLRRDRAPAPADANEAPAKPKRGRPRKAKSANDAVAAAPPTSPQQTGDQPAPAAPGRRPRNRAGRAPIADPPAKPRRRGRP